MPRRPTLKDRRKPVTFKIEPNAQAALVAIAAVRGQTPSALIRDIVLGYLDGSTPQQKAS
jgi:hypothetical protein